MEKVLITGTTGFIGKHLSLTLSENFDVYCIERYMTGRYIAGEKRLLKTIFADLNDYPMIRRIVRELKPDYAVHLAAISPVSYSYDHPFEVLETNFFATVNLAETCMRENPMFKQFLFAGSSEEYGNQKTFPIKESFSLHPNSPYSVSKAAADKYLQYMRDAYNFPVTILRNFNTYGRIENVHFVVERIITQALNHETIELGAADPVRDFMYVSDHVNSYVTCLGNNKAVGEVFNFCTGKGVSIKKLVNIICKLTGFNQAVIYDTIPSRPLDIDKLIGDYGKAERLLNWKPKVNLKDGLKKTIKGLKVNK